MHSLCEDQDLGSDIDLLRLLLVDLGDRRVLSQLLYVSQLFLLILTNLTGAAARRKVLVKNAY